MTAVSACLVTRGDVDMTDILAAIFDAGIRDVHLWDNSVLDNSGVYGRYRAIERARHPVVYVQDDDCVVPPDSITELIDQYQPGKIVANMPQEHRSKYSDSCLIGFGAVFDKGLPAAAFKRMNPTIYRPDVVFTALTPMLWVDLPFTHQPWAFAENRMYRQKEHTQQRTQTLMRARRVRRKTK
jgi:hypothetical protein